MQTANMRADDVAREIRQNVAFHQSLVVWEAFPNDNRQHNAVTAQ